MLVVVSPLNYRMKYGIFLFITTILLGGCSEPGEPSDTEPDPALGPVPVLWNLGLDFDAAFNLDGVDSKRLKFLEFGFEVNDQFGDPKMLPHFTYVLDRSTEVISPMEGIVASVHLQDELTQDFAVWLKPHGGPTLWLVEFDHITELGVAEGDEVEIGDFLGYPVHGTVELMVNGPTAHVCPFEVFAPEVIVETQLKLLNFLAAWDSAKWALPEDNLYHPENPAGYYTPNESIDMAMPGCLTSEVPYPNQ